MYFSTYVKSWDQELDTRLKLSLIDIEFDFSLTNESSRV